MRRDFACHEMRDVRCMQRRTTISMLIEAFLDKRQSGHSLQLVPAIMDEDSSGDSNARI